MSDNKEEPRVGVFVCRCGLNVAKSVDTTSLKEYASKLPGVVYAEESDFACSDAGVKTISEAIKANGINRVVVAGCSPWLHEPTFQRMMERVRLNKYLLEMANIREHCALLYPGQILKATEKAKFIVKAAVERAKTLEPIEKKRFPVQKSVLVIGGGVAGVEASKRLGDLGMEVFLVEKTPFLGGKVLQLGSVFPSDDCGTCVSPCGNDLHRRCFYRNTVANHEHVNILTSSVLRKLTGHIGNYKATIGVNPRFVNQELCMGCDRCADVCPVEVPNEFNFGLDKRKAIYILSDQALPRVYAIDPGTCTRCGKCVDACPVRAIDLGEQPREMTVDIGAVVVASGFETFDPKGMHGYGENPNVVTQLQLARMLDQSGPTRGRVIRPGDGQEPKRIAMIQCVGSRDTKTHEYCSKICCGIAVKHATEIMERYPEAGLAIIHKDIRLTGKHYEDYYYRAQNLGVRLLRGEVEDVTTMPDGSIHIDVKDEFGEIVPLYVDLLVLSTGLEPSEGAPELAQKLGVAISADGFFAERGPKLEPLGHGCGGHLHSRYSARAQGHPGERHAGPRRNGARSLDAHAWGNGDRPREGVGGQGEVRRMRRLREHMPIQRHRVERLRGAQGHRGSLRGLRDMQRRLPRLRHAATPLQGRPTRPQDQGDPHTQVAERGEEGRASDRRLRLSVVQLRRRGRRGQYGDGVPR